MADRLLTVQEVADRLRVPLSWVYDRTRSNDIPGQVKIGKYVRIRESELESYIEHGGSLKRDKVEKTFTANRLHIDKFEKFMGRDLTTHRTRVILTFRLNITKQMLLGHQRRIRCGTCLLGMYAGS